MNTLYELQGTGNKGQTMTPNIKKAFFKFQSGRRPAAIGRGAVDPIISWLTGSTQYACHKYLCNTPSIPFMYYGCIRCMPSPGDLSSVFTCHIFQICFALATHTVSHVEEVELTG